MKADEDNQGQIAKLEVSIQESAGRLSALSQYFPKGTRSQEEEDAEWEERNEITLLLQSQVEGLGEAIKQRLESLDQAALYASSPKEREEKKEAILLLQKKQKRTNLDIAQLSYWNSL